jgi:hypothetical protein
MVGIYESLAEMYDKRIGFDFHEELKTVEIFAKAIDSGVVDFNDQHFGSPLIPDWKRVESAIDGILPISYPLSKGDSRVLFSPIFITFEANDSIPFL